MTVYTVNLEDDVKVSRHGRGGFCDGCGKKKDTKKVGKSYLCVTCRTGSHISVIEPYENTMKCWCSNTKPVAEAKTCKTCGAMICGLCGDYCENHLGGSNAPTS